MGAPETLSDIDAYRQCQEDIMQGGVEAMNAQWVRRSARGAEAYVDNRKEHIIQAH